MHSTYKPTNQQRQHSAMQPNTKMPTSKKQPCSNLPIRFTSSGIKPREAVLQQSCNTPHIAGLIPKTRRLLALCMLPRISRGKKTRQFSSHQQSALLSLIFGRSSSAARRTALTNQQIRNSNSQPCNLLGKAPTSSTPIVQFKPHQEALQQSCNTPHMAGLLQNSSTVGPVHAAANQSGKED